MDIQTLAFFKSLLKKNSSPGSSENTSITEIDITEVYDDDYASVESNKIYKFMNYGWMTFGFIFPTEVDTTIQNQILIYLNIMTETRTRRG